MTIDSLWESYQGYTRDLTEIRASSRLALGNLLVLQNAGDYFSSRILWSLSFLAGFFVCDVLHYLSEAILYRIFNHRKKIVLGEDLDGNSEVNVPRSLDRTPFFFFCAKATCLILAAAMLIVEFYYRYHPYAVHEFDFERLASS